MWICPQPPHQSRRFSSVACSPNRQVLYNPTGRKANIVLSKLAWNNTQDVQKWTHDLLQHCSSLSIFYFDEQDHQPLSVSSQMLRSRSWHFPLARPHIQAHAYCWFSALVSVGIIHVCPFPQIAGLPLFPNSSPCLQFCSFLIHSLHWSQGSFEKHGLASYEPFPSTTTSPL